jgi:hypothetical protein
VTYISLAARSSAARQLCSNIWYIRQLGSLQIVNLPSTAWHIAARHFGSLAFRQLGSSTDRQLGSSGARQHCKLDSLITWQLGFVILYFGSWVAWHLGF